MKDILIINEDVFSREIENEDEDDGGWELEEKGISIWDICNKEEIRFIIKDNVKYNKDWEIV